MRNRTERGGGILVAKRNGAEFNLLAIKIHTDHEQMWLKVNDTILAVVYGPIESRVDISVIEDWYFELEKEYSTYQDEKVLIIGDINAHVGNDHLGVEGNHEQTNKSGVILRSFLDRRDLSLVNNSEKCTGKWTREDPSGAKSILDLVIGNNIMINQIRKMKIDEDHKYKISRKKKRGKSFQIVKSDHNTILIEIDIEYSKVNKVVNKIWNIRDEKAWDKYKAETNNIQMNIEWQHDDVNKNLSKWNRKIKSLMYKYLDRITVKEDKITNTKIRTITKRRKAISKEISSLKKKGLLKSVVIDQLLQQQETLKNQTTDEVEKERIKGLERRMKRLMNKASVTNEIWKIRKRNSNKNGPKLAVKSKDGTLLTGREEINLRYSEYYRELLQNREGKPEFENYSQLIEQNFKEYYKAKQYDNDPVNMKFSRKELESAIKTLKREKSTGPDDIYNELIINAGENLRNNILEMINHFWSEEIIPEDLYRINIKSIYKGKGDTSNLENHRGIFLSSTILKLYEKMILIRATPKIEKGMSKYQAGGRKNYSTKDQVFIVRSIINKHLYLSQPLYLEFIDLRKAFDKMVLKNVMHNLWQVGIRGRIWRNIYKINQKATIKIKSNTGITDEIVIGDILKQGSVIAANLAALHTDNVAKRFNNTGLGVYYGKELISLLLYQDDIIKFDVSPENLQKSNIILEIFQHENKMEYHKSKSVLMTNQTKIENITLNSIQVPIVNEYKYLGDIIVIDNTLGKLIEDRKNAIYGVVAEIVSITSETRQFNIIASIQYLNGIIQPKLLLNCETWFPISKKEMIQLEQIYSQSIKRMLHIPFSTPTLGLFSELGISTIENLILKKQLMYVHNLYSKPSENIAKTTLVIQEELPGKTWVSNIKDHLKLMEGNNTLEDLLSQSKYQWKKKVDNYIQRKQQHEFEEWSSGSTKCSHMKDSPIKIKKYIQNLSPIHAKIILEARLGLIDVKTNYKNKHNDDKCRNCLTETETTLHFITCLTCSEDKYKLAMYQQIFDLKDITKLKIIAEHILKILRNNNYFEYKEI